MKKPFYLECRRVYMNPLRPDAKGAHWRVTIRANGKQMFTFMTKQGLEMPTERDIKRVLSRNEKFKQLVG